MSNHAFTTKTEQAVVTMAGALVCLVIILAMFSAPHERGSSDLLSGADQVQVDSSDRVFFLTAENVLSLFVIGLVSGTFGGMLGMGGGVLKMSFLLLFFGFHPGVSKLAALLSYFVVALGASYRYLKLRLIMMEVVKVLIPSSIVGVILGAMIGQYLPRDVLTLLLGVFLLFVAVVMVKRILGGDQPVSLPGGSAGEQYRAAEASSACPGPAPAAWRVGLCGFPGGFLSAMLGISGGVVSNPLQQVLAGIPIKNAIANTLAKASVTVPIACLMIMVMGIRAGDFDFWSPVLAALCLIPGSLIGSQLGPALMERMSSVEQDYLCWQRCSQKRPTLLTST